MNHRYFLVLGAALAASCGSPPRTAAEAGTADETAAYERAAEREFLLRLKEGMAAPERSTTAELFMTLERMLPSWQAEQRRQNARTIEELLTVRVVTHFDQVIGEFQSGTRERRLVAAWALGFSRVPANDFGLRSPHPAAVRALAAALGERDDELLRNVLLAIWKIGQIETATPELCDLGRRHHDPDVRANALLALGSTIRSAESTEVRAALLDALRDSEPRVRLHAADAAARSPSAQVTEQLLPALRSEQMPLVRARIALALGSAKHRFAAETIAEMLESSFPVESEAAHAALIEIFGVDRGPLPADWVDLLH